MERLGKALAAALFSIALSLCALQAPAIAEEAMGEEPLAAQTTQQPNASEAAHAGESSSIIASDDALEVQTAPTSGVCGTCQWSIDPTTGAMAIRPVSGSEGTLADWTKDAKSDTSDLGPRPPWNEQSSESGRSVTSVRFEGTIHALTCKNMFLSLFKCTSIDLTGLDTSQVTDMSYMFSICPALREVDLSSLDTSNVTTMSNMFMVPITGSGEPLGVTAVKMGNINTSKLTDMTAMFSNCGALKTLEIANIDTSHVTSMVATFGECDSLESLDVSKWNTSNVSSFISMFGACSSLKALDLSNWDVSHATNMAGMFSGCEALKELDISSFDTSKATTTNMLEDCTSLQTLKVGAKFDTNKPGLFPAATASNGKWWSIGAQKWLTVEEIGSQRNHVADTYANYEAKAPAKTFPDVPADAWYGGVVSRAVSLGLLSGYRDGRFGPNDSITRGQVAVILWNMAGKPAAGPGARSFPDVEAGRYYYDAVRWASSAGVVSGYAGGTFGPNDNVTREQLAVMLANYAGRVAGKAVAGSAADYAAMRDAGEVSGYARPAVGWCFRNKILSGTKDGRVNPKGNATRAEGAKMVTFFHGLL